MATSSKQVADGSQQLAARGNRDRDGDGDGDGNLDGDGIEDGKNGNEDGVESSSTPIVACGTVADICSRSCRYAPPAIYMQQSLHTCSRGCLLAAVMHICSRTCIQGSF